MEKLAVDYSKMRRAIRCARVMPEALALQQLQQLDSTDKVQRNMFSSTTERFISKLRRSHKPDLLSQFISEYSITVSYTHLTLPTKA